MEENKVVLTMQEIAEMQRQSLLGMIKELGLDKVDRKHGIIPDGTEKEQKELSVNERFPKFLKAVLNRSSFDPVTKATLVEGSGSGSYVVPVEYANFIATKIGQYGVARRYCRVLPMTSSSMKIPDQTATITVTVPGENTAYSELQPTLLQKTLTLKAIGGISPMSNELLADNNVGLLDFFAQIYGEALALFEDTNTFGSGANLGTALLGLSSGVDVTAGGVSIANFTADDLNAMRRAVNPKYWTNAKFFAHPYVISYIEQLKDTAGNYIVRQPANSQGTATIWGHDLVSVDGMPSADAASTSFVGFADPALCFVGTQGGLEIAISQDASLTTAGSLFEKNLSAMRVIERFGMVWTNEAATSNLSTSA